MTITNPNEKGFELSKLSEEQKVNLYNQLALKETSKAGLNKEEFKVLDSLNAIKQEALKAKKANADLAKTPEKSWTAKTSTTQVDIGGKPIAR